VETELVLHVGMHKTGTSAIQSYLRKKTKYLLSDRNILYVREGRVRGNKKIRKSHYMLACKTVQRYSNRKNIKKEVNVWSKVNEEIKNIKPKKAIISSEFLWPAEISEIRKIDSKIKDQIRVILYVRSYYEMLKSVYMQHLKKGYSKNISKVIKNKLWYFDYVSIIKKWEKVIGEDNVGVGIYDRVSSNVVGDFIKRVGIGDFNLSKSRVNASPPDSMAHILRGLNNFQRSAPSTVEPIIRRTRKNISAQRQPGKFVSKLLDPLLPSTIISPSEWDWFRKKTEEMRTRFLEEYVSPEDRHLFDV